MIGSECVAVRLCSYNAAAPCKLECFLPDVFKVTQAVLCAVLGCNDYTVNSAVDSSIGKLKLIVAVFAVCRQCVIKIGGICNFALDCGESILAVAVNRESFINGRFFRKLGKIVIVIFAFCVFKFSVICFAYLNRERNTENLTAAVVVFSCEICAAECFPLACCCGSYSIYCDVIFYICLIKCVIRNVHRDENRIVFFICKCTYRE